MKLGSLFDGSGGFPLAGALCDIQPVWAAEVEPYPIAVTRSRFPNMKHLGDISKINGGEIEPVDIITFGSPCQDLSVAGKRAGLKHEANGDEETTRSGLFMEAVRIIKEMRKATNGRYPTFALWENVPGAFSSNKGEDFRIVCEELIKIIEPSAVMPEVPKNGWNYSDSYIGDGWSLAYRVFDAQYWGVPQRRRRIHLVVDFRGERASEILFEREGVRGYFAQGGTPWQATATDAQDCTGADDRGGESNGGRGRQLDAVAFSFDSLASNSMKSKNPHSGCREVEVAKTLDTTDPVICLQGNGIDRADTAGCNGRGWNDETCYTLNTIDRPAVAYSINHQGGNVEQIIEDKTGTLTAAMNSSGNNKLSVCYRQGGFADYVEGEVGTLRASGGDLGEGTENLLACRDERPICVADHPTPKVDTKGTSFTLSARDYKAPLCVTDPHYIVRRLTPTECARLQGFADWWGHIEQKDSLTDEEYRFWLEVRNTHAAINGKKVQDYTEKQMLNWYNKLWTDAAEYKMWGNGIALPPALYCLQGIVEVERKRHEQNGNNLPARP